MLFAYLSNSVNVTSVYEMYPIGWFSIKQRLADHRFDAKIVNVASLMLMHPDLDVRRLLGRLEAPTARSLPISATRSFRCGVPSAAGGSNDVTVPQQMIDGIRAIPAGR